MLVLSETSINYNSLAPKLFTKLITFSSVISNIKKSVVNDICSYYGTISKRFLSPVTIITNFWIRLKIIVETVVMTDLALFWFISFSKITSFRILNFVNLYHFLLLIETFILINLWTKCTVSFKSDLTTIIIFRNFNGLFNGKLLSV